MWRIITVMILLAELVLLVSFLLGRARKRKLNETALFIAVVFVISLALHIIPYLYNILVRQTKGDTVLSLAGCLAASLGLFLGRANTDMVSGFAADFPLFSYAYLLGVVMALLATVSATVEAFRDSIRNAGRVKKALKKDSCDLVIGSSPEARKYARTCNAILLLGDSVTRNVAAELVESGFAVLRKSLTGQLLEDRRIRKLSRCNVVCFDTDKALEIISVFAAFKKANPQRKNAYLYVQLEESKAETIRREIIEKNGCESWIDTFCTDELLARAFAEEHPVTRYLPQTCIEDGAVRPDTDIHIFFLGFGKLSRELYRQCILNNQLVTYRDGTYRLLPIHYHICDTRVDARAWNIDGLKAALEQLRTSQYLPLPELPYDTQVTEDLPGNRETLLNIKQQLENQNSFGLVIVDIDSDCGSIEIGARLKTFLAGMDNFRLFIRSEAEFVENDSCTTYFGKGENVYSHSVIVNECLSAMAKKLNEIYTAAYESQERSRKDFGQYIAKKAEEAWRRLDYFTLYSNIFSAMSLRVKLNLLGLDYAPDGRGEGVALIGQRYPAQKVGSFDAYGEKSLRNALIAQEHARWNAYHLLGEYLPLEKDGITVKSTDGGKVRFQVKNPLTKQHACLTTYQGLAQLSAYLAQKAGDCQPQDYDYYIYDEMLITSAQQLLAGMGYSVKEK